MVGEIEAAGELATGALLGRAVEPNRGEGHDAGHLCLNCGTALIGAHCHRCGQSGHVHRSLGAIGHEILHGVAHFEGKLWRTLPLLAWWPGELTRRYVEGERARFVSPMALFLFSIFAMFAVFSWAGISAPADLKTGNASEQIELVRKGLADDRAELIKARDARAADDPKRARDAQRIAELDEEIAGLAAVGKASENGTYRVSTSLSGWAMLDHGIEKWKKNPSLMLYKLQASSYKFSWLLIPLSLPFMWLLFAWRREFHLYDHTVFVTYSIAFMSLLLIAVTVLGEIGASEGLIIFAVLVVPFVHLTRQLKQAYALRWFPAIVRSVILSFFILIVILLFLIILLALGMS
ncbi:DUF3667 domain-containing protein [Sphingomonas soli]|uniref:DUF3667 domain-containing protein n=1 Tax=Sphingomonas soli TaxID=266127 RepID=UPI00082A7B7B|nr:DUF3667 domain-containing protein [Sphingomonas soli]